MADKTTAPPAPGQHVELPKGVKATSGGKYDRDAPRKYFVATGTATLEKADYPNVLVAVNEIETQKDHDRLARLCENRSVLLDSGIFNLAMNHARTHEVSHDVGLSMPPEEIDGFDKLWDRYGEITTKYKDDLWGMIELDQGGVENKPRTRARIEKEFGIVPMPVYHPLLDGWDYYDDIAANYDRMCFGNLVKAAAPTRLRLMWTAAERARDYPYLWTHLLGVTANPNYLSMNIRGSCDSSSWIVGLRWGPSWHGKALTQTLGNYPRSMWPTGGGMENLDRSITVAGMNTKALQYALDDVSKDIHEWH